MHYDSQHGQMIHDIYKFSVTGGENNRSLLTALSPEKKIRAYFVIRLVGGTHNHGDRTRSFMGQAEASVSARRVGLI